MYHYPFCSRPPPYDNGRFGLTQKPEAAVIYFFQKIPYRRVSRRNEIGAVSDARARA